MSNFIWPSIGLYCLFGIFVFYQQFHANNFQGGNPAIGLALSISALVGTITGIAYLGYYTWTISWWSAPLVFVLGLQGAMAGLVVERLTRPLALSLGGLAGRCAPT